MSTRAEYEKVMEVPGTLWRLQVICKTLRDGDPREVIVVGVEADRELTRNSMINILEAAISSVERPIIFFSSREDKLPEVTR